jgi:hypothetical protein
MSKLLFPLILLLALVSAVTSNTAQPTPLSSCSALVQTAIETVGSICSDPARNEACYGNVQIDATLRQDEATFANIGDRSALTMIESLQLSALDLQTEQWGVALLNVQANLPDTLPGQNVTFLLFGDTELVNLTEDTPRQAITVAQGVNVRLIPSETATLLGSLNAGETLNAAGRYQNAQGEQWIRVEYYAGSYITGWITATAVSGDLAAIPLLETADPLLNPMQAFYFTTGIGQTECVAAPPDGILVQSPNGVGRVNFNANGIDVQLGSTAFMQAQAGQNFRISVIEGSAVIRVKGVTQTVIAGTMSEVPLGADGLANGTPSFPRPYDRDQLLFLSPLLSDLLTETITEVPAPREVVIATATPLVTDVPPSQEVIAIDPTATVEIPPQCGRTSEALVQMNFTHIGGEYYTQYGIYQLRPDCSRRGGQPDYVVRANEVASLTVYAGTHFTVTSMSIFGETWSLEEQPFGDYIADVNQLIVLP